ncbi:uncharacterized protein K460DRAFT_412706 [Cucurbitaria berberidis CBS 394.84]|uniref:Uncharacterized protein n=1 Tax=Cucurbitaria berberidis CBS 394.84 TaxID=1168544 RepID=A0A9P4GTP0_9PLEO|nr:uncharacterized protein K460DRAFT_412706 [Cucurbitaria berberidis CBS 394.84]KAF1851094.1 hypothetical protein K460DRAFT_412706 [Cucurbitaria berberidis CBS 394.84]
MPRLPTIRLPTILNSVALTLSLTLIALSTAIFYLTGHGMQLMDNAYPPGRYTWYRGPSWDMDSKHTVLLQYDSANEGMILAAGVVSCLAGLVGMGGAVAIFLTQEKSKATSQKLILSLRILPGALTFIITFIALIFTTVIFFNNNNGNCFWEDGYNPKTTFTCTREQAACNIGTYFQNSPWWALQGACGQTQTGRHLVAPLFVASVLMFGLGVATFVMGKKGQNEYVESPDERVERLQRGE